MLFVRQNKKKVKSNTPPSPPSVICSVAVIGFDDDFVSERDEGHLEILARGPWAVAPHKRHEAAIHSQHHGNAKPRGAEGDVTFGDLLVCLGVDALVEARRKKRADGALRLNAT